LVLGDNIWNIFDNIYLSNKYCGKRRGLEKASEGDNLEY
jgi:hypothetical protein